MTGPTTGPMQPFDCDDADALAGAWALDALDADEARAIANHLEACDLPHEGLRAPGNAALLLAEALEPIEPSPALRARVMASVGATRLPAKTPWYRTPWLPRVAAGLAAAAVLALAVWNVQLQGRLADRESELRSVAAALSTGGPAHTVTGPAGGGLLVTGDQGPVFVGAVAAPAEGRLYEMWLIDADGNPRAVGTFVPESDDELVVAGLELPLEGFTTFAVTLESRRVDAPTSEPILAAPLT
jgi:anti-sigma-K factor RskA